MTAPIDLEALRGHTPGPWSVFHDHYDPETAKSLGYIRQANGNTWFEWGFSEIANCFGCETPEQAANTRLIAAAPTLLAEYERLTAELTARRARDAEVEALVAATRELPSRWRAIAAYNEIEMPDSEALGLTQMAATQRERAASMREVACELETALAPFTGAKP